MVSQVIYYQMYRGNADRVMADAARIVERLRETDVTLIQIKAEYHCAFTTLYKAIFSQISKREYRKIAYIKTIQGGIATRFKKGNVPFNKCLKGIHLSPDTEYKKGHLPDQHKHVGTISIHNDKCGKQYRWIKISGIARGKHKCCDKERCRQRCGNYSIRQIQRHPFNRSKHRVPGMGC